VCCAAAALAVSLHGMRMFSVIIGYQCRLWLGRNHVVLVCACAVSVHLCVLFDSLTRHLDETIAMLSVLALLVGNNHASARSTGIVSGYVG